MSYTFAICNATLPVGYKAAEEAAFRLQEESEPNPAVFTELIDRLTTRYPCICDLPDDDAQNRPWCSGPLRQKSYTRTTVFGLIYSRVDEVMPFVIETATALGLSVVDWQTGTVHRPKRDSDWTEVPALPTGKLMTEDEIWDDLYRHLRTLLSPLGFTLRRDEKRFVRWTGDVLQSVIVNWHGVFEYCFTLDFGFTVEAAQLLELVFSGDQAPHPTSPCCRVELAALTSAFAPERFGFIKLWPFQSAEAAMSWLKSILERDVFPFLASHQDIPSLDRLMNGDERHLLSLDLDTLYPAVDSIIFAYLTHNPNLPRLVAKYRTEVVPYGEIDLASYDRLANHLLSQRGLTT